MLIPTPGQEIPSKGSSKLIEFTCSCGKKTTKPWKSFVSGRVKSCGKCGVVSTTEWESSKYGSLRMKTPVDIHAKSHKIVEWVCDCGKTINLPVAQVTTGRTSSCGKCFTIVAEKSVEMKFGHLKLKTPVDLSNGSHIKTEWVCDCGRETIAEIGNVVRGLTKSCGKCSVLTKEHFEKNKYGSLTMKIPDEFHPNSEKESTWKCDCGREITTKVAYVVSGQTKSCGWCNAIKPDTSTKFGRLRMKFPVETKPGSHAKITWLCDCGGETDANVFNVSRRLTSSCGKCYERAIEWYISNKECIKNLQPPISPNQIPEGFLTATKTIENTMKPFTALCGSCGREYSPMWDNVRRGKSLTCGCCTHRVSKGQYEIAEFIKSIGVDATTEKRVGGLSYDIASDSKNLLIEYNGLIWHHGDDGKRRDLFKYENATKHGWKFVSIFEDEWLWNRHKVESFLVNKLRVCKPKTCRPSKCEIISVPAKLADEFHEKFHYIGRAKSPINYLVSLNGQPVACISFKRPTRQSKHDWELVRMASDPRVRVHGIWSKLLKKFVNENNPKSVVSFSDNRLFSGESYLKLGFELDGGIPPDYYWCKGQHRWHKSGLRKTSDEKKTGMTEFDLRTKQGYFRVWDIGKKRWVYSDSRKTKVSSQE